MVLNTTDVNDFSRFGSAFTRINRSAQTWFASRLKPYRIGPAQQAYLLVIGEGEELSQEEIARRHGVDKANAARAVSTLEQLGYVSRRRDPDDRRNWIVALTPRGGEVRTAVEEAMREWVVALREAVPAGTWKTMINGLETMARTAERAAGRPPFEPHDEATPRG